MWNKAASSTMVEWIRSWATSTGWGTLVPRTTTRRTSSWISARQRRKKNSSRSFLQIFKETVQQQVSNDDEMMMMRISYGKWKQVKGAFHNTKNTLPLWPLTHFCQYLSSTSWKPTVLNGLPRLITTHLLSSVAISFQKMRRRRPAPRSSLPRALSSSSCSH